MFKIRRDLGMLAVASLFALALASETTGFDHSVPAYKPADRPACETLQFAWDPIAGCADKSCLDNGVPYRPGATRIPHGPESGHLLWYYCDGFVGQWIPLQTAIPTRTPDPSAGDDEAAIEPVRSAPAAMWPVMSAR